MGREFVSTADDLKASLKALHSERDAVFRQILEHEQAIPPEVGMDGRLVDREGFPRADIDVAAIRTHRQQIIRLRNDHSHMTDRLEALLTKLHALPGSKSSRPAQSSSNAQIQPQSNYTRAQQMDIAGPSSDGPALSLPFVLVEAVAPGSPAQSANLQEGDRVLKFGNVTSQDPNSFQSLTNMMMARSQEPIEVVYLRLGVLHDTIIHPRPWAGQGLVGVKLVPIK